MRDGLETNVVELAVELLNTRGPSRLFNLSPHLLSDEAAISLSAPLSRDEVAAAAKRRVKALAPKYRGPESAGLLLLVSDFCHGGDQWINDMHDQLAEIYLTLASESSPLEALTVMLEFNAVQALARDHTRLGFLIALAAAANETDDVTTTAIRSARVQMYEQLFPRFEDLLTRAMSDTGRRVKDGWTARRILSAMWQQVDGWLIQKLAGGLDTEFTARQCAEVMVQIAMGLTDPNMAGPRQPASKQMRSLYNKLVTRHVTDPSLAFDEGQIDPSLRKNCFVEVSDLADEIVRIVSFGGVTPDPHSVISLVIHLERTAHDAQRYRRAFESSAVDNSRTMFSEMLAMTKTHLPAQAETLCRLAWSGNFDGVKVVREGLL